MSMDIGNPYANWYYGDEFGEVEIPEQKYKPSGEGMTPEEVQQMINDALSTINVSKEDDDTVSINVNGNSVGTIDDVYLESIDRDDDTMEAVFNLNNGKDPIRVDLDKLDNPNIDCSTF